MKFCMIVNFSYYQRSCKYYKLKKKNRRFRRRVKNHNPKFSLFISVSVHHFSNQWLFTILYYDTSESIINLDKSTVRGTACRIANTIQCVLHMICYPCILLNIQQYYKWSVPFQVKLSSCFNQSMSLIEILQPCSQPALNKMFLWLL